MAQSAGSTNSTELHDLFKEDWEWFLREYPEYATHLGDPRYNGRLTDFSPEAIDRGKAHEREMLGRVQTIDRGRLAGQDVISCDLFLLDKQTNVDSQQFPIELMPVTQMDGPHLSFGHLVASMPFENVGDYENYVERLKGYPHYLKQNIYLMQRGLERGWTPAAVPMRSVPSQIDGQIVAHAEESQLFRPFRTFPKDISADDRERLTAAGKSALEAHVMPALQAFSLFVKETYLPGCRTGIAAGDLEAGADYYRFQIRRLTTTNFSPQEIHTIGVDEVARIRSEMDQLIRRSGFTGSFAEFLSFLRTDRRFYFSEARDMVNGYAAISKRMDAELPKLFAELPRTPYGVREIPEYEAPAQTTAYYLPGATDGSRAGFFYVNTYKLETRPKYEMEALTLHEAVPGHHLQIARAQELKGLPDFRRNGNYTAYIEGWALYSESLGNDIGFYSDEYSRFGQLSYEMWRACRLVVDTGIHALGWSRQKAIEYMLQNSAKTENDVTVEVDRYIVWPGQALTYKLGELKIKELRATAQRKLGERFDIRKFHNAVLDNGAMPLSLLEKQIDSWVDSF